MVILLSSGPPIPGGNHGPRYGGYAMSAYEALTRRVRTRSGRRSSQGSPSAVRRVDRATSASGRFSSRFRSSAPASGFHSSYGVATRALALQCFAVARLALGHNPALTISSIYVAAALTRDDSMVAS